MSDTERPDHTPTPNPDETPTAAPTAGAGPGASTSTASTFRKPPYPERIGPYRILGKLGSGGMGEVYLGAREDSQFAARVAIKCVRRGIDSEQIIARFKTERRILAAMNHPSIARLVDGGMTDDGMPYLAMEYVEGQPIDTYCDRRRLNIEDRLRLFIRVCEGVHFAHQNLVVHRDLKPANILVTEKGDPKLLDFGIAKLLNPDLALVEHAPTLTRFRVMTPEYASPEQVRQAPITTSSDIYSLGVILFELLTGHRPYKVERSTQDELERLICEQDPERPSTALSRVEEIRTRTKTGELTTRRITPVEVSHARDGRLERLRRRLSGDLDNIVLMALRKEPQRRYSSAEELARDIERHLHGMPVIARPDTIGYRASKFVRRNRASVVAASAVMGTLVLGMAGTTYMQQQAVSERTAADAARRDAEAQRNLAQRRFEQLQTISGSLISIYDEVDTRPGQLRTGRELVETAATNFDRLRDDAQDDPVLAMQLAYAYERLGDVQGGMRQANFGDHEAALASFRRAREIYSGHAPDSIDAAIGAGRMEIKVADMLQQLESVNEALAGYEAARDAADAILRRDPGNRDAMRLRSGALLEIGDTLKDLGRLDEAEAAYAEAVRLRERMAEEAPNDPIRQRDLAIGLSRVGGMRLDAGDPSGALDALMRSREIRRSLAENVDANDLRAIRDLYIIEFAIADAYRAQGNLRQHRDILRDAIPTGKRLIELEPDDARVLRDVASNYERLGNAEYDLGNLLEARDIYLEALEATARLRAAAPSSLTGVWMDIVLRSRLGDVFASLGNADAAAPHLDAAERSLNASDGLPESRKLTMLGSIAMSRAAAAAATGNDREAERRLREAIDRYSELPDSQRASLQIRYTLAGLALQRAETMRGLDPRRCIDEAARARTQYADLGDYGILGGIEAAALAADTRRELGELEPAAAALAIREAIGEVGAIPETALRRLASAEFAAGNREAAYEAATKALEQLDASPKEGWRYARLREGLLRDRDLYRPVE